MSSIKIVSPPPGKAPEEVKKELVDLMVSLSEQEAGSEPSNSFSYEPYAEDGYQVKTNEVLCLLFKKSPRAALWYLANGELKRWMKLPKEVCELLR